ncbi:MAG: hypothetical protein ACYTE3_12875 [Planctomycetota bacterium]
MAIRIKPKKSVYRVYRDGEFVVRKWFAWWPVTCKDREDRRVITERRWLETVYIWSRYHNDHYGHWWTNIYFVDEEGYLEQVERDREILRTGHDPDKKMYFS